MFIMSSVDVLLQEVECLSFVLVGCQLASLSTQQHTETAI